MSGAAGGEADRHLEGALRGRPPLPLPGQARPGHGRHLRAGRGGGALRHGARAAVAQGGRVQPKARGAAADHGGEVRQLERLQHVGQQEIQEECEEGVSLELKNFLQ